MNTTSPALRTRVSQVKRLLAAEYRYSALTPVSGLDAFDVVLVKVPGTVSEASVVAALIETLPWAVADVVDGTSNLIVRSI